MLYMIVSKTINPKEFSLYACTHTHTHTHYHFSVIIFFPLGERF